jgi:membrane protease YdiL (CAAX protease family)
LDFGIGAAFSDVWDFGKENLDPDRLLILSIVFISGILALTYINLEQAGPSFQQYADVALMFLVLCIFSLIGALSQVAEIGYLYFITYGENHKHMAYSLLIGFAVGVVMASQGFSIAKLATISGASSILTYFYVSFVSPAVEELFFRGFLQGTVENYMGFLAGAGIQVSAFVFSHFIVYGANVPALIAAGIFGLLVTFINKWRGDCLAGFAAHFVINNVLRAPEAIPAVII